MKPTAALRIKASRGRRVRRTPDQARDAILDAAERLISEHSFSALRIELLMQEAGMGRTAFYHYYPDLGAVAADLLRRMERDLLHFGSRWLEQRHSAAPPQDFLHDYFLEVARYTQRHRAALVSIYHATFAHAEVKALWEDVFVSPFFRSVRTLVRHQTRNGAVTLERPDEVIRALLKTNIAVLLDSDSAETPEHVARTLTQIWYRTLYGSSSPL